ncbi:MAG: hypothetical protein PHT50_05085 [Candidatus Omnitrophica bacterium]|nr:hypothetical protein [Candidatus Omnitrophota bacterium]
MRKKAVSFISIWLLAMTGVLLAQDFTWEDIGRANLDLRVLLVNPQDSKIILAAGSGNIFKSGDAGQSWRRVLGIRSGSNNINALVFDPYNLHVIYAATDNGLYRSRDSGERWERVFRGKNNLDNQCTAVLVYSCAVFAGTKAGLFISRDNGRSWQKESVKINKAAVLNIDISFSGKVIYLSSACGIFKSTDGGESWERIFVGYFQEDLQEAPVDIEDVREKNILPDIHFVRADNKDIDCVYFCGARGVYKSLDQGKTWSKLPEYGLLDRDVKMVCLSADSRVFALTQSGVFFYQDGRWRELTFDLDAGRLQYLFLNQNGDIYVAGRKGIFKSSQKVFYNSSGEGLLQEYLKYEPKISDLQEAAIKYAEVSPDKISRWRRNAAKKALLPKVSIGLDRNSTDLWHWETGSSAKSDDDTLRHGQESIDWDVALSWDLSDLIWNDAQTSIDVRSKLMVELRDDILDQVNKLFFERLRVKSELDNLSIEDRNKRFDKQLKLEELTASLDSLTAGYYSEQLQLIMSKN